MRKTFWVVGLLLVVAVAPAARADSFDASFTCTAACASVPTDPVVWFPSPIIPISFYSKTFTVTLNSGDSPTDKYTWGIGSNSSNWYFQINDVTTGWSDSGPSFGFDQWNPAPFGSGCVNFDHVLAPEPYSGALLLLGIACILLVRRRMRHRLAPSV